MVFDVAGAIVEKSITVAPDASDLAAPLAPKITSSTAAQSLTQINNVSTSMAVLAGESQRLAP
jgi:hypothetical protein